MVGQTRAFVDGVEVELRRRERMLLAALSVDHPAATPRDVLIDRLWPEGAPTTARKSLQNHVARLRRALGHGVITTIEDGYRLSDDLKLNVVEIANAASGPGSVPIPTPAEGLPFAELASAAPGVTEARRRVISARTELRLHLARHEGDSSSSLAFLERAVDEDPYAEHAWLDLAEKYGASGRRRDAAQTFSRARRTLAGAGLAMGDGLGDAERLLLANSPGMPWTSNNGVTAMVVVGSQNRLRDEVVSEANNGPKATVIYGPAGAGKTTVLELVATGLSGRGMQVTATRCEAEPVLPLEPIAVVVENILERAPFLVNELDDPAPLSLLSPAVASIIGRARGIFDPERRRLQSAVVNLLNHPALQPLAILVDDLHWSTATTRALIGAAVDHARTTGAGPSLVASWRGPRPEAPLGTSESTCIEVRGLDVDEIETVLGTLVDLPTERHALAARLHAATAGNPLFVREMIRSFAADPVVGGDFPALLGGPTPALVSTLLAARVGRLSVGAGRAAQAAAVLGRGQETADVLAIAPGGDVEACIDAGILRVASPGSTEFDHDLLRQAVLDSLGPVRRVELHDIAARAIEESPRSADRLTEIAHHTVEAGVLDPLGAAHYATEAAQVHTSRAHHLEAADILGRAASVLEETACWPARRVELVIEAGAALMRAGDPNARTTLESGLELATEVEDPILHAAATIELCKLGPTSESGADDPVAVTAIERALREVGDRGLRARVAAAATMVFSLGGDGARCREMINSALHDARADGRPEVLAAVMPFAYMALSQPEDLDRRRLLAEELAQVGGSLRRPDVEWEASLLRFGNALQSGHATLRDDLARMETLAAVVQERARDWQMEYLRATVAQLDGDLERSEEIITGSLEYTDCVAASRVVAVFGVHLLALRALQGRLPELVDELKNIAADQPGVGAWQGALAMAAAEAGRHDIAAESFDRATEDDLGLIERDFSYTGVLFCLGRAAVVLGDAVRAATILPFIEPWADRWSWVGTTTLGPLGEVAADCFGLVGRAADAAAARDAAMSATRQLGAPLYSARLVGPV